MSDIREFVERYYHHFFGIRLKIITSNIKLWHREVMEGPDFYLNSDNARSTADFISLKKTDKWLYRVWKYHLEAPPYDNDEDGGYWYSRPNELVKPDERNKSLTNKGVRFILDQYREEKTVRRDTLIKWATFGFSAIAAFGVLLKLK